MNQDQEHLRLLSIFHYVVGGIMALFACFPVIHLIVGIIFVAVPQSKGNFPGAIVGLVFILSSVFVILFGWTLAILFICAGGFLAKRKHYTFCLVIASIGCMFTPFGTVLGVFTIIVLARPTVKELFAATGDISQAARL